MPSSASLEHPLRLSAGGRTSSELQLLNQVCAASCLLPPVFFHSLITKQPGNLLLRMLHLAFLTLVCKFNLFQPQKARLCA